LLLADGAVLGVLLDGISLDAPEPLVQILAKLLA
jgi:hypothetical protein